MKPTANWSKFTAKKNPLMTMHFTLDPIIIFPLIFIEFASTTFVFMFMAISSFISQPIPLIKIWIHTVATQLYKMVFFSP